MASDGAVPITPKDHPRPPVGSRWWHTPTQRYVLAARAWAGELDDELTITDELGRTKVVRRGDLMREDLGPEGRT